MNRLRRHIRPLLAITILSLWPGTALAQQNIGTLFFYHSAWDKTGLGHIDSDGRFHYTELGTSLWMGTNGVNVVRTSNGILVYDVASGQTRTVPVTQEGLTGGGFYYSLSPGWTEIVSNGPYLFFYKKDGSAAIARLSDDGYGYFVQTQGFGPGTFGTGWWYVVATDNNIVFYDGQAGIIAVGHIDIHGLWHTDSYTSAATGCHWVIGAGRHVLCFHMDTGQLDVYDINRANQAILTDSTMLPAGRFLKRHGRDVIAYDSTGAVQIGHIDHLGHWVGTQSTQVLIDNQSGVALPATHIASTGEHLLFYNNLWGASVVGLITRDGQFLQTDSDAWDYPGWTNIVATAAR